MNRRGFLAAMLATGCAPAIVRASSLMKIVVPTNEEVIAYSFGKGVGKYSVSEELLEITRRAFVPKLKIEIYNHNPFLQNIWAGYDGNLCIP